MRKKRWWGLLWVALATGCDEGGSVDAAGERGELNNGTFFYVCNDKADAQCDEDAVVGARDPATSAFPPLARGGRFSVRFEYDDDPVLLNYLIFAGPYVEGMEGSPVFTAVAPGVTAVAAVDESSSLAYDLVHLTVVEPAALRISETTTTQERVEDIAAGVDLELGSDAVLDITAEVTLATRTFFRAAPVDGAGNVLAGALDTTWTSSDPGVVAIVSDPENNVIEIEPLGSGTATLTVTMGDLTATVPVEAGP